MARLIVITSLLISLMGCQQSKELAENVQIFIEHYTQEFQNLYYQSAIAEWASNTQIIEGDSSNSIATRTANEALANFTGSVENIEKIKTFLQKKEQLTPLQVKQLEAMLYMAANNPQTVPDLVRARIKAETEQTEKLYGFDFKISGNSLSTNEIDRILREETDLNVRLKTWEASKEVGKILQEGLVNLQKLRNQTVQALGYADYFSYQVSEYGMNTVDMLELNRKLVQEVWPLYRELHTYARYELAKKYGSKEVPDLLPAHWLPNRWGQDWSSMVTVEGLDLDAILKQKDAEWVMQQGERFYLSLGFPALPASFWEKSSLYPLPENAGYKKNNHASAWHMDLDKDVRSLMSVIPNTEWYETVHHELGHVYYYISYTNPEVPLLLREGANRAFHEAIGSLMGLAAMQKPFIAHLNLLPADIQTDEIQSLLKEALNYIVFIPWSAGVMTEFENALYSENLPADQFNQKWWAFKKTYQGIEPPSPRGEEYCDAASKTHISDDAAQYYDYALSYALLFQFHSYISKNILNQDPHATNYYGSEEVGQFLKEILSPGGTRDWRKLLQETINQDMSAQAMLDYFQPLMDYLKKENQDRKYTLPDIM
ncbi:MAG: M2 family metallopeptidase [bacterium]|nr:MAG: M2 family metallopeptidase [bacterium]